MYTDQMTGVIHFNKASNSNHRRLIHAFNIFLYVEVLAVHPACTLKWHMFQNQDFKDPVDSVVNGTYINTLDTGIQYNFDRNNGLYKLRLMSAIGKAIFGLLTKQRELVRENVREDVLICTIMNWEFTFV